jgi:hypothetical protein
MIMPTEKHSDCDGAKQLDLFADPEIPKDLGVAQHELARQTTPPTLRLISGTKRREECNGSAGRVQPMDLRSIGERLINKVRLF